MSAIESMTITVSPEYTQLKSRILMEIDRILGFRGKVARKKADAVADSTTDNPTQVLSGHTCQVKVLLNPDWEFEDKEAQLKYLQDWIGSKMRQITLVKIEDVK